MYIYKYTFSRAAKIIFSDHGTHETPAKIVRVCILNMIHPNAGGLEMDHLVLKLTGSLYINNYI